MEFLRGACEREAVGKNKGGADPGHARLAANGAPVCLGAGRQHEGNALGAMQGLCRGITFHTGNNQSSVHSLVFVTNQKVPRSQGFAGLAAQMGLLGRGQIQVVNTTRLCGPSGI